MTTKSLLIAFISIVSFTAFSQQIGNGQATNLSDFSTPLLSGFYQGNNPNGKTPDISNTWQHLITIRHSNLDNNHQLQIGSSYTENDRLFFRKLATGLGTSNPSWIEIASRGSNTFTGNQIFNGNVGIGTANPTSKLHINNGNNSYGAILANATEEGFSFYTKTLNTDVFAESFRIGLKYYNDENNGFISFYRGGTTYGGFLGFSTNGAERIRVAGNGNVGIGTTSPTSKLDVNGVIQAYNKDNNVATWDNVRIWADGTSAYIESNGDENGLIVKSNTGNKILLMNNVGIGTQNPDEKLTVKGKIHAEEIKVDLSVPADYVFQKYYTGKSSLKKDYVMPTLTEVEKYTKEHNHLPNIPSAQEMKDNGLELGKMNNLLLQKIEELTLYVIEQQKEIQLLKEKINK